MELARTLLTLGLPRRIVESAPTEARFAQPNCSNPGALLGEAPCFDSSKRRFEPARGKIPSPLDPPSGCHIHPR